MNSFLHAYEYIGKLLILGRSGPIPPPTPGWQGGVLVHHDLKYVVLVWGESGSIFLDTISDHGEPENPNFPLPLFDTPHLKNGMSLYPGTDVRAILY